MHPLFFLLTYIVFEGGMSLEHCPEHMDPAMEIPPLPLGMMSVLSEPLSPPVRDLSPPVRDIADDEHVDTNKKVFLSPQEQYGGCWFKVFAPYMSMNNYFVCEICLMITIFSTEERCGVGWSDYWAQASLLYAYRAGNNVL